MRTRALALFAAAAALVAACAPPKYAHYKSISGDFSAYVPWGWSVIADADHDAFSQVNFIGPFDPDFFLGAPSISVRWYKRYAPHRLRDGRLEMYADADDFVNQILHQVYGPKYNLYGSGVNKDGVREVVDKPETILLKESGYEAKYFGVLSPTPAPVGSRWGVYRDADGRKLNVRLHDYAIVSVTGGFYVFCYPATLRGHDTYADMFNALINTFHPYAAGPGGPKISVRRAAAKT